jgi:propane monooxygenase coupling protein
MTSPSEMKQRKAGATLMKCADAEVALEYIRETNPAATITFRDVYYKIECAGPLKFDMAALSEIAGHEVDTDLFLVNLSSFYGRIVVNDDSVELYPHAESDSPRA